MATGHADDPAAAADADFDYTSDDVDRAGVVSDLESRVDGDVRFDSYSRQLYATDASAYEMVPVGVVLPTSTADVAAVVRYCARRGIPVLPRGGGTSLAGQAVNEAVVLDCSKYMDGVERVDPEGRTATAQPGVTLAALNADLEPHGLKFAPDPAWGDKSVLGGAIGNNSTGSHSLKYGKTDAYVEEVEAVLADGTVTRLGETPLAEIRRDADPDADGILPRVYAEVERIVDEEADEVEARYPDLKRNVSGYNLGTLVEEAREGDTVNLARLLAGSEGTLAVVTEATVSLEPIPETKAVALLTYDSLGDAMTDVAPILKHDPAAVEVLDGVLLDLARETAEFSDVVGMLPEGTNSVLLVEFYAEHDDDGRQKVADLVADRVGGVDTEAAPREDRVETGSERVSQAAMEAHDPETRARFWKLRKSGLPILLSRTTDEKHISFIEDTAIPPENLPEYVAAFEEILDEHDTFASYYAHAGPGVLHIRPLVNTKAPGGVEAMESIADAVTDLVVEYGGSVSGEHGDGRARTQWNRKLYGDDLWATFQRLKTAFDPDWLLNPGSVCGDHDMTEHLRFSPDYEFDAGFEPTLSWETENGFQGMAELCHGCGGCRGEQATTGGVMCPTYRVAHEEIQSTRGRANMLRAAMSGDLSEEELFSEAFGDEVLDLCIGCKGCAHDCPSEVDMAKMKAELEHERHRREGTTFRDRVFANVETFARLGSRLAPVSNVLPKVPGARRLLERTVGIARERSLPTFHGESFAEWAAERESLVDPETADRRALLLPDTYTNYTHPERGKAAVRVLEAAGVHVTVPETFDSGRPAHSKGFLDQSRETARGNVGDLAPEVRDGRDVVVVEPSDAVMVQSDYLDLLGPEDPARADAEALAANTYGIMEYLDTFRLDEGLGTAGEGHLTYHGHCHQKAVRKDHHAVGVLRRAGYAVDPLDSTCCGMAGSFGYEAEHYAMSRAVGDLLDDQVAASEGETVVAPGASCRTQLGETHDEPAHPVEQLAAALQADRRESAVGRPDAPLSES